MKIKKDFKGVDIDQETANAYKSLLWSMVKEKNADMKSNLDLSVELEKMATLETLTDINIKDVKERLNVIKSRAEEKQKKKPMPDTISETSDVVVTEKKRGRKKKEVSESSMSETSDADVPEESISATSMSMSKKY